MENLVMYGLIKIWWIFPFAFVFSLVAAIKEVVKDGPKDGPNDLKYALISAVSLFVLVAVCMPYYNY